MAGKSLGQRSLAGYIQSMELQRQIEHTVRRLKAEFFRRASPPPSGKYEVLHLQPEEWEKENTESPQKGRAYKL